MPWQISSMDDYMNKLVPKKNWTSVTWNWFGFIKTGTVQTATSCKDCKDEVQRYIEDRDLAKDLLEQVETITRFTLDLWFHPVQKYRLEEELIPLWWIAYDRHFAPVFPDQRCIQWIPALYRVIKDVNLMGVQDLKQNYTKKDQDYFRYLQLRGFYDRQIKHNVNVEKNWIIRRIIGV